MSGESASAIHKGQVDLLDFIDWSGVECLNQSSTHSLPNAIKQGYREDDGLHLESDADEQLLLYIPFTQVVKLYSFVIKGPEEEGPKTVKLFSNKEHMGFSNVNDFPPSDVANLSEENLKGKPVLLKYVKFQNVRSLTIFIEDNQSGSEITKVQKIVLHGTTSKDIPTPNGRGSYLLVADVLSNTRSAEPIVSGEEYADCKINWSTTTVTDCK
ncbi:hypothetical protein JHK82_028335 [Glycine max]|nr:hypothetical protein JHK86_028459 [Glycine max]KAG5127500.1 hypothetical protein JHK82_028335 [Glycine max]KAG5152115.1 hypothetical protein JHK84_028587 [Glycine max]